MWYLPSLSWVLNCRRFSLQLPHDIATLYQRVVPVAACSHNPSTYIIHAGPSWSRNTPRATKVNNYGTHRSTTQMAVTASKYPFFFSFLAGVLSVAFVGALTVASFFAWHYFRDRRRRRRELTAHNLNAFPLTALEDGLKGSGGASDEISSRSPSRLGGVSPPSLKRAASDEEPETRPSQFSAQLPGTADGGQHHHPVLDVLQRSAITVNSLTTEGLKRAEDHTKRTEESSNRTTRSNDGDTSTDRVRARPSDYPSRSRSPAAPPIPPTPTARLSVSTVWSQESMWPREKRPDVPPLPSMPALAHMQGGPRRAMYSPVIAAGSHNRRSTSSLPRSVGQSDYEDYI